MRKRYTLLVALFLTVATTLQATAANGNFSTSEKKTALTILVQQVNRDVIRDLQLNEMQYIQLKYLNRSYQQDLDSLKIALTGNTSNEDTKAAELTNKYFTALSEVLTPQQIAAYVSKQQLLAKK